MTTNIFRGVRRECQKKIRVDHPATERMPAYHTHTYEPDGSETGDITITIDIEGIVKRLGARTLANKTGKSTFMHGLVKLTASNRKRIAQ